MKNENHLSGAETSSFLKSKTSILLSIEKSIIIPKKIKRKQTKNRYFLFKKGKIFSIFAAMR
jgi:hypothetical protein